MRKARNKDAVQAIPSFERTQKSHSVPIAEKQTTHYGNIIRQYRERSGMDQRSVAAAIGYSANTISNWENGVSRPDIDAVPQLCKLLQIPLPVFFDIEHDPSAPENESELLRDYRALNADQQQTVLQLTRQMAKTEAHVKMTVRKLKDCLILPVQPLSAAAGVGTPADELPAPGKTFVTDNKLAKQADAIYLISGDSMEPTYHNGDHVYVQHTLDLKYGEIGIFIVSGTPYIKEYRKNGLYSHNRNYRIMKMTDDDDVRLVGRVLGRVEEEDMMDSVLQEL